MFKKLSALTLAVTLALTLVGSAFAQSDGRGGIVSGSYSESGVGIYKGEGGELIMGGYSESGKIIFGESGGSTFLGANIKKEGFLWTGSGMFYFEETIKFLAIGQPPNQQREQSKPPTIVRWLIASKKPASPYPHAVFITEIEKVYHADDECPKILLKRKLPITLKQALEWEYKPCPVCVPKAEKERE